MSDLYNKNQILEMIGHSQNELEMLINMFLDLCPKMLDEIDKAISDGNYKNAGDVAHKLKSSLRLWDINTIIDDVIFIELNGKKETLTDEIKIKAKNVRTVLEVVLQQMKEEVNPVK